ncbi:hypothetical protein C7375_101270 [Frischella perrara]|nr:hypothetical protein C7375_101270 [Frischella perrara]
MIIVRKKIINRFNLAKIYKKLVIVRYPIDFFLNKIGIS